MSQFQSELIEKYQVMLDKDPKAKIFAPLAEAYRQMGLVDEGLRICRQGVRFHPNFASGRVALGRLLLDEKAYKEAVEHLKVATELAPENLLAYNLLGEVLIHLKRPKDALQAFKMVLFLNPVDPRAQGMVQKLESLTADEFEPEAFSMAPLTQVVEDRDRLEIEEAEPLQPQEQGPADALSASRRKRDLERFLSLADAFMVRGESEKALGVLREAEKSHGPNPEIVRRLTIISHYDEVPEPSLRPDQSPRPSAQDIRNRQIAILKRLKAQLEARRRNS